jgi:hypothetical protein
MPTLCRRIRLQHFALGCRRFIRSATARATSVGPAQAAARSPRPALARHPNTATVTSFVGVGQHKNQNPVLEDTQVQWIWRLAPANHHHRLFLQELGQLFLIDLVAFRVEDLYVLQVTGLALSFDGCQPLCLGLK